MRRAISVVGTSIVIGATMASFALAQRPRRAADVDHFLQNHPQLAQRLAADSKLADDPEFLAKHPALKTFLITHPDAKTLIPSAAERYAGGAPDAPKAGGQPTP